MKIQMWLKMNFGCDFTSFLICSGDWYIVSWLCTQWWRYCQSPKTNQGVRENNFQIGLSKWFPNIVEALGVIIILSTIKKNLLYTDLDLSFVNNNVHFLTDFLAN